MPIHDDVPSMMSDGLEIESIHWDDDVGGVLRVGEMGVEKIQAYGEPGQMGYVPFLAVYKDGQLWQRIPANTMRIMYKQKTK